MRVSEVSREDALRAAQLANFMKSGKWQMTGEQAASYAHVVAWFHNVCMSIAKQIPPPPEKGSDAPQTGMKIKSLGKLPAATTKSSPRRKG